MSRHISAALLCCLTAWGGMLSAQEAAPPQPESPPAKENASPPAEPVPLPFELQPYQIRLFVAEAHDAGSSLRQNLADVLDRSVGSLWHPEIAPLEGLSRTDRTALERWTVADVENRWGVDDADMYFAITVHQHGSQTQVAVRAWQPRFDWLSPVHEAAFYEPRETANRIVQLCWDLFRPQVLIEHVERNDVRVRILAGDLQPADPAFVLLKPGDCLIPWLFYYDRDKKLKRRQELPWSYVRLDKIDGVLATGTVLSGLRSPLPAKTRGRIDRVAVVSKPVYPSTRLQLGVQNQPNRLLPGYRLELRPKLPERRPAAEKPEAAADKPVADKPVEDVQEVLTNRIGEVDLAPAFEHPLTWIFVYSGDLMLARVPFIAGSLPVLRLEVPDDSVRLQAVGDLQALESELINVVAARNTLIATTRAAAKLSKWERVVELRKELDALPDHGGFQKQLAAIRVRSIREAKARKDRSGEMRIVKLCNRAAELIDRYLDPEKIRLIKEELDELQKAIKDAPP